MNYPCGIIQDLLPLYVDGISGSESTRAVDEHLAECEKCRQCCDAMKEKSSPAEKAAEPGDIKMADSLKSIKAGIHRKIRSVVLCSALAVFVIVAGLNVLFNAAVKNVLPGSVSVSAEIYSVAELAADAAGGDAEVSIPEFGTVSLSSDELGRIEYVTVVSHSSEYFLRTIKREVRGDTIYVSAFKTTLLNNDAAEYQRTAKTLVYSQINRIVFLEKDGSETVLWSR